MAKITKTSDNMFNGRHPNDVNVGYSTILNHKELESPVVGERYHFGNLLTSTVKEVIHDNEEELLFKTRNSTYLITK